MPIKNYTTSIAEDKTVGEIMGLLAAKGARTIQVLYDELGRPSGVSFMLVIQDMPVPFRLPCNFDGVFKALLAGYKDRTAKARFERNPENRHQSRRIAWRIVKDWVAAQMALIEAEQATLAQVFLPYCTMNNSGLGEAVTMYDRFMEEVSNQRQLGMGGKPQ
jgi:hypothetical protein